MAWQVPHEIARTLGQNVYRLRLKRSWTQEELALNAEVTKRQIQRIEAGTANSGIVMLSILRATFECSWTDLLGK